MEHGREKNLGRALTPLELRCYQVICDRTAQGIGVTGDELFYEVYGNPVQAPGNRATIYALVARMRDKLGEVEILEDEGIGYRSRRVLNSMMQT